MLFRSICKAFNHCCTPIGSHFAKLGICPAEITIHPAKLGVRPAEFEDRSAKLEDNPKMELNRERNSKSSQ